MPCQERYLILSTNPPPAVISVQLDLPKGSNEETEILWLERLFDAVVFKKRYGHQPRSNAPYLAERSLGSWVSNQKTSYRKGFLAATRMKALERSGLLR